MSGLRPLPVPGGAAVRGLLAPLERALAGQGALAPYAVDAPVPALPDDPDQLPHGLALAVGTSGSTGVAKRALLTVDNLVSSAGATSQVLGGAGTWLLAMPAHHIAGLQVLVRSVLAGTEPELVDLSDGFRAESFVSATRALVGRSSGPRYTALVPTQVIRLLEDPAGTAAMAEYDAILVGGAAVPSAAVLAAERADVRLVRTYGMSETAGGCVYDGSPLPVSLVHIDNDQHVVLGGSTVAHGYLGNPHLSSDAFEVDADGTRWFCTDDLGVLDGEGLLHITGRADDLINTGGLKVMPGVVEDAIVRHVPGVCDVVVVGTAHPSWGQAVSAAVTLLSGAPAPSVRDVRSALHGMLPDHALPHRLLVLDAIPLRGPGKPDRCALVTAFDETLDDDAKRTG